MFRVFLGVPAVHPSMQTLCSSLMIQAVPGKRSCAYGFTSRSGLKSVTQVGIGAFVAAVNACRKSKYYICGASSLSKMAMKCTVRAFALRICDQAQMRSENETTLERSMLARSEYPP
jgi:hypothetical protein